MPADDLTKTLSKQKHEDFVRMIGLINISDKLAMKQRAAKKKKKTKKKKKKLGGENKKLKKGRIFKKLFKNNPLKN